MRNTSPAPTVRIMSPGRAMRRSSASISANVPFRTTEIKLGIQGYLANANYPASSQASIFESAYFTPPTYIAPLYPDGKLGAFSGGDAL